MSSENVAVIERNFEAFESGEVGSLERLAPDFEIGERVVPEGPPAVRGPEALAVTVAELREAFGDVRFRPLEFVDLGERVLVRVRIEGTADRGGLSVGEEIAHLYTFRDGLIVRLDIYRSWPEGREAAGREP